ncbi:MAG TPA: biopolymer transporter ExbD [Terriglobia bacterium]|nr:biopolymer transporter ExbD [Terriglobia bacterium]
MAIKVGGKGAVSDINVTPMVDIMLVLLIIFMVITPMLSKDYPVDMAKAQYPRDMADAEKEDATVIAITRDGKLFLSTTPLSLDEVTAKVKDRVANREPKTVYLKCDARAKYGDVVKVVDNIRAAGVEELGLLAEKLEKKGAPPTPSTP